MASNALWLKLQKHFFHVHMLGLPVCRLQAFLDCMSRMQHGRCHVHHAARRGPSRALVQQYQQRLRRLLTATRGCVIGVDLSSDTD